MRSALALVLLVWAFSAEAETPPLAGVTREKEGVRLKSGWLKEEPPLGGELPALGTAIDERWSTQYPGGLSHCYHVRYGPHQAGSTVADAVRKRGGRENGEGLIAARTSDFFLIAISRADGAAEFGGCWGPPADAARLRTAFHAVPLLAPLAPATVEFTLSADTGLDAKAQFDLEGVKVDTAGAWLARHGFKGDRIAGWSRLPDKGHARLSKFRGI
jgi:hypothetical protein